MSVEIEDIHQFYRGHAVDPSFNVDFYKAQYPETEGFYQPFCNNYHINDKHRLYYHYFNYGIHNNYSPNINHYLNKNISEINFSQLDTGNIELFWPASPQYRQSYINNVLEGRLIAKNSNIAIASLARNCGQQLDRSIKSILQLECQDFRFVIFENDSTDNTKDILYKINHPHIYTIINNYSTQYKTDRSRERTTNLAEYRNICKQWIVDNYRDCDYVIVLDLDADLGFSIEGIYDSIYRLHNMQYAGGMGSYSLYLKYSRYAIEFAHYDSFATRLNDWQPTYDYDINNNWFRYLHPLVGSDPIPMYSCFGGLGVYKKDAFMCGTYDGSIGSEHVLFHKRLRDNGYNMYLNPSSRFFSVYNTDLMLSIY